MKFVIFNKLIYLYNMKIQITVTKEILKESAMCGYGFNSYTKNCAIALAVREIFPNASVGVSIISTNNGKGSVIDIPEEATNFIREFDKRGELPLSRLQMPEVFFEIDVPANIIDEIGINEIKEILSKSETLNLVE